MYKFEQEKNEHEQNVNKFVQEKKEHEQNVNLFEKQKLIHKQNINKFEQEKNVHEENLKTFEQDKNVQKNRHEQNVNKFEHEKNKHEQNVNLFQEKLQIYEQNINEFVQEKNAHQKNLKTFEQQKNVHKENVKLFERQKESQNSNKLQTVQKKQIIVNPLNAKHKNGKINSEEINGEESIALKTNLEQLKFKVKEHKNKIIQFRLQKKTTGLKIKKPAFGFLQKVFLEKKMKKIDEQLSYHIKCIKQLKEHYKKNILKLKQKNVNDQKKSLVVTY